jgi:hypothetical protein
MAAQNVEPPNPSDQDSGKRRELPDPELSPMTNPILSRNLGKWAQVYFTSPPEKRAQAVAELVQELEETSGRNGPDQGSVTADNPGAGKGQIYEQQFREKAEEVAAHMAELPSSMACPECAHINSPDHWFCGFCGSPLKGTALKREQTQVARSTEKAGDASVVATHTAARQPGDVEWLRAKTLSRFDTGRRPLRRVFVVTLVLGGIGLSYYEWRNLAGAQTHEQAAPPAYSKPSSSRSRPAPASAQSNVIQGNPSSSQSVSSAIKSAEYKTGTAVIAATASKAPAGLGTAPQGSLQGATQLLPDTGDRELAMAEAFLKGETRRRDATEAAKWLWKSVSKHNAAALILLADLYERGDGVSKSCDQAQVLLVAAAKKGSSEAGQKLKSLQSTGCR